MPKKLTTEQFIEKAKLVHGNRYDYSLVDYITSATKIEIICKIHGPFFPTPSNHVYNQAGCLLCGNLSSANIKRSTTEQFIEKAKLVHGDKYDYSLVDYVSVGNKVQILCTLHGMFLQTPRDHCSGGYGCPTCGYVLTSAAKRITTDQFIEKAKLVHGDRYDYSLVDYVNNSTAVDISCAVHGIFSQQPVNHFNAKSGCPKCASNISKQERDWLNSHGVPDTPFNRQHRIRANGVSYTVDGFIPETNTIYEFWGDFWHGNPNKYNTTDINPATRSTFGELYQKTIIKRQNIIIAGYHLVEMWESDWKTINKIQTLENTACHT